MKMVAATCSVQYSGSSALFEHLDYGLPARLLASPALVRVVRGTAYIPIVSVGSFVVLLYPQTVGDTLDEVRVVSLPAGVIEIPSSTATMVVRSSHGAGSDRDHRPVCLVHRGARQGEISSPEVPVQLFCP